MSASELDYTDDTSSVWSDLNQDETVPVNNSPRYHDIHLHLAKQNSDELLNRHHMTNNTSVNNAEQNFTKCTIANEGFSYPPSRDSDFDDEVSNILQTARINESPRSLVDLERVKEVRDLLTEDSEDTESYGADREDNETRRIHVAVQRRISYSNVPYAKIKGFPVSNLDHPNILPPPQIKRHSQSTDLFLESESTGELKWIYTTEGLPPTPKTGHTNKKPYHPAALRQSMKVEAVTAFNDTGSPKQPFALSRPKWNASSSCLYPSSNDTVGSGYGSMDYSSETDQSHDTLPTSNRSAKINKANKSFKKAGSDNAVPNFIDSKVNKLPLVPEDQMIKIEEENLQAVDQQHFVKAPIHGLESTTPEERIMRRHSNQFYQALREVRGFEQPAACHDMIFGILFVAQLTVVIILGIHYGPQAVGYTGFGNDPHFEPGEIVFAYRNVIILVIGSGIITMVISSILLFFITISAQRLIPMSLFIAMSLALMWSLIGIILSPQSFVPIMGLVTFGISVAYTFTVWEHIPFVTAQLNTAISALKEAYSIVFLSFLMQMLALVGIVFYFFTWIGIHNYYKVQPTVPQPWQGACYVGIGISFIWTFQVLSHLLKVTACGVVHKWWSCQPGQLNNVGVVRESFLKSATSSFGSICLGSLFIGPANFLRQISDCIRPNKEGAAIQSFVVLQELIVSMTDNLSFKFSKWAFAYVAIYGYNYFDAGRIAQGLFIRRGWKQIIDDELLGNALIVVSLVIGGVVGCLAVLLEDSEKSSLYTLNSPSLVAYTIGAVVGVVLSNVIFGIISISVDAVVISFAGSPDEFDKNHHSMSQEMRTKWRETFPGTVDFIANETSFLISRIDSNSNKRPLHHYLGNHRNISDEMIIV